MAAMTVPERPARVAWQHGAALGKLTVPRRSVYFRNPAMYCLKQGGWHRVWTSWIALILKQLPSVYLKIRPMRSCHIRQVPSLMPKLARLQD